jgi:hypothetical protein
VRIAGPARGVAVNSRFVLLCENHGLYASQAD